MTKRRSRRGSRPARDRVAELREAANWSSYTNSYVRWPVVLGGRGRRPPGSRATLWTFMASALIAIAVVWVAIMAVVLLVRFVMS